MAKAQVTMPGGISVRIEGTPEEIRTLVRELKTEEAARIASEKAVSKPMTLVGLFQWLIDDGFFKEPRDLGGIRAELEGRGHHYPVTTLSGAVLRLVKKRILRRLKREERWFYTRS